MQLNDNFQKQRRSSFPAPFSAFAARGVERADGSPWPESGEGRLLILAGFKGPVFLVTSNFDVIKPAIIQPLTLSPWLTWATRSRAPAVFKRSGRPTTPN
jgi:hypothetical protein